MTRGFVALLLWAAVAGCGGGGGGDDPDGGTGAACDPRLQTGCDPGEKCGSVVTEVSGGGRALLAGCVPNGSVAPGEACTAIDADADELGAGDPCAAQDADGGGALDQGYECHSGTCHEVCAGGASESCDSGAQERCDLFASIFPELSNTGVCLPECDPVTQRQLADPEASCRAGEGCYLNLLTLGSVCLPAPAAAAEATQDLPCIGPGVEDGSSCFLNGCAVGHSPLVLDDNDSSTPAALRCAFYCNPGDTHTGAPENRHGDPAGITCAATFPSEENRPDGPGASHDCRFVQTAHPRPQVPANIGFCVDPTIWGNCTLCDLSSVDAFLETCGPSSNNPAIGCISVETLGDLPQ